jgi:2-polyprenyl-3-methyl-5-hydroxy-6-metoxy-1,4-benzoquinol methylase
MTLTTSATTSAIDSVEASTIESDEPFDEARVEKFAGQFLGALLGAFETQAAYLGDRLGWYRAMAGNRSLDAAGLAAATSTHPRYCQEWLEHQAVSGWIEVAADSRPGATGPERRYRLPAEHATVLTDPDSLAHMLPLARFTVSAAGRADRLAHVFTHGGGVSWAELGDDARQAQAALNRPMFLQLFGPEYLPSIPEVDALLRAGGRVADIGCGLGWSSLAVAQQYPGAVVDGFDPDGPSVTAARANAAAAGVADRVRFHERDAAEVEGDGRYAVVMALECIHDLARPVQVLAAMRRLVADDGVVLVMDERVDDGFRAPGDELERLLYGASLTSCLPDGLSGEGSVGTGTVMRPSTLAGYAREAGFSRVTVLPIENDSFRFYRLVPGAVPPR